MAAVNVSAAYTERENGEDNGGFDPVRDLLTLQEQQPARLRGIDMRSLTPFQRALLVIDGTVTKFLEAYALEPVEVIRLHEETQTLAAPHALLELPEGEPVITRQVLLQGRYSSTVYAYAASVLALKHLPAKLLEKLETEPGGLGRALLNSQIENRRELLWTCIERLSGVPEQIERLIGEECISRTYRIIAGGKPAILVNEKFPRHLANVP